MKRIKRKIVMTLAALSLGAFMIPLSGCYVGPGGGWGGGGYGGGGYGSPGYVAGPVYEPAYVGGHPWGYDHYGWAHDGHAFGHPAFAHDDGHGFGHADGHAFGHVDGGHAVAHAAHGEAHGRG
jgi:hypothetical protein